jgi:CTP:molybdopterin cytidylyltransferase MocA
MTVATPRLGAVVLAAGASTRLGSRKQLLRIGGVTLVRRATLAALSARPARTIVVVGAHADSTFQAVADLGAERLDCKNWADGMGASLRAGARALSEDVDGLLVVLCDQPEVSAEHIRRLVTEWDVAPDRAVASAYAGTVGVPAILPRSWFADLIALAADRGARDLLRRRAGDVTAVAAPELSRDIDEPGDLDAVDRPSRP